MAAAVFRAKFTVPSVSAHHCPRPRLDSLWERGDRCRLLTITAGAGWGKSDFLAARARAAGNQVLWYALDDLDRDPTVLAAHLTAACELPPSEVPPLEQLAAIVGCLDSRSLLVLDDVHTIADSTASREFLSRLLRYLPPSCALAIASREPVDLAAAHLDARGEAVHLTEDDLALTVDETRTLLGDRLGEPAAEDLVTSIHTLTEGWPTGVEICCQALAEVDSDHHQEVLARLQAGEGRWFDLFSAEVLADLDTDTRDFLLRTSVLDHLEPDLCDRLLQQKGSGRILTGLAVRGLFITSVGKQAWRYHNLMKRCLRRRLETEFSDTMRRRLYRRAAKLMAEEGEPEAASLSLIQAGDELGAASLVAGRARDLADSQRPETLALTLAGLSEKTVRASAPLLLVRAGQAHLRGDWDRAESDLRLALRRQAPARIAGAARSRQVRLHLQRGAFARCLASGRRTLSQQARPVGVDRGLILASMGVAVAGLGRMDQGESYLQDALVLARRLDDRVLEGRCLYLSAANIHYVRGDLDLALQQARQARDLYHELGRQDLACHAEGVLGFVLAGRGLLAEARASSLWSLQRAEAIGYRLIEGYARLTLGSCELLADDPDAAAVRLGEALALARELGEKALETWAHLGLAETAWQGGDLARSRREAQVGHALAVGQGDLFCRARALALLGRGDEGEKAGSGEVSWQEAAKIYGRLGAELEQDRLRLWRAAAGCEDPDLVLASIESSDRHYLIEHLEAPLVAKLRPPIDRSESSTTGTGVEPLHVSALGPLVIMRGDQELASGAWRSRRARRLFNLLILKPSRSIPREVAMETMWPEADPRKATGNLRQSVFQLRKVIEPEGVGQPCHVLLEGEMIRLDLGEGGTCDLDVFEGALVDARRFRREGQEDRELECLTVAVDRWRGSILADTPYDAEAEEAGSTLRHHFLRSAERLLDIMATRRRWEDVVDLAQRSLTEDPLHEPFAVHLLGGLLALGNGPEALEAYARFERRMVRELDLLPSGRLKEIVERVGVGD